MTFQHSHPKALTFGPGAMNALGDLARRFGTRTLLVTGKSGTHLARARRILSGAGVEAAHYDGVVPNPTLESISAGARIAREYGAQSVIGLGGGSAMDSAKAIAVEATHEGSCWDYLFFRQAPTEKTLPIIAVTTTSGTGSHVTQVAVVTNMTQRDKSALYHSRIFPRAAIVDPELMFSVPAPVTAATGFDAFCHAFESTLHPGTNRMVQMFAWEAIALILDWLPKALADGFDARAREAMAWADTLAGYSIASAGVTLPHGIGMAIGGMYPHVAHGVALAAIYPAFARFTCQSAIPQFERLALALSPGLNTTPQQAAEASPELLSGFLASIGLRLGLGDVSVPEAELSALARQSMVLPDYQANPRVATLNEIEALLAESHRYDEQESPTIR